MKRLVLLLAVAIGTGAFLFGETGYKGIQWFEHKRIVESRVTSKKLTKNQEIFFENEVLINETPILGTNENVYYFFYENELYSISYQIPAKKSSKLESYFNKKVINIKTETITQAELNEQLKEEFPGADTKELSEALLLSNFINKSVYSETSGYEAIQLPENERNSCTLSIYDYNDDTRVYIYENVIEGQTVVVYVPHEQDY